MKAQLSGGALDGQTHQVDDNTKTICLAIDAERLDQGCYVYGIGKTDEDIDGNKSAYFTYLGRKLGITLGAPVETSSKLA